MTGQEAAAVTDVGVGVGSGVSPGVGVGVGAGAGPGVGAGLLMIMSPPVPGEEISSGPQAARASRLVPMISERVL